MASTKKCSSCSELKSTTQFSKYKKGKDGLQPHCKQCQSSRTSKLTNAGTTGSIYKITNQEGESYIGKTFRKVNYRFGMHISQHKHMHKYKSPSCIPLLFASFRKYGVDSHTFELVAEYRNISKEALRQHERNLIKIYKQNKKSLNTND